MSARGVLLVRSEGRLLGIPLVDVAEVTDLGAVQVVPATSPSMRGVTTVRGRMVPLFHLGALVGGRSCPVASGNAMMVLARVAGRWIALEVDEVDAVPQAEILQAPMQTESQAWTLGAVRRGDAWVAILNLEALAERWQLLEEAS